jgi:hypothetical protein
MNRKIRFTAAGRRLLMHVTTDQGRPYTHACDNAVFEEAAWQIQQLGGRRFSRPELRAALPQVPHTQLDVALAFLKHYGCVLRCGRHCYAPSVTVYEDALGLLEHQAEILPL